jgi:hypothetical protein
VRSRAAAVGIGALAAVAGLLPLDSGSAHVRPNNRWTAEQAASVRLIRGTRLYKTKCRGLERRRVVHRHFACSGQTARDDKSIHTALVTYVLHPLGRYYRRYPAYFATKVRFAAFSVP